MPDILNHLDDRIIDAQAWFLVGELVRRHPGLRVLETHPHGGQHDCLAVVCGAGPQPTEVVNIARSKFIWFPAAPVPEGATELPQRYRQIEWIETLTVEHRTGRDDRHDIVRRIEHAAHLAPPAKTPASTPAALTYRVAARILAALVDDKHRWDLRSEFADTTGQGGSWRRNYVDEFPTARRAIEQTRPDDILGNPAYRFWALLRGDQPVAILDTDGQVHLRDGIRGLPAIYASRGRSLTLTIAEALGDVLP